MEQIEDDKILSGYEYYNKQPLAYGRNKRNSELYSKGWVRFTGMACMHPHPHRHFTYNEFVDKLEMDIEFKDKFIK